jgi:hypothetical protein
MWKLGNVEIGKWENMGMRIRIEIILQYAV